MGAGSSQLTTNSGVLDNVNLEDVKLDEIIPKFSIEETPIPTDREGLLNRSDDNLELLTKGYNKLNDELNQHIKLNNIQFNYKTKNNVILKDLDKKIQTLNSSIKNSSEDNYKHMRKTMNNIEDTKRLKNNRKMLTIAVVFFSIITLALILGLVNRKMKTGKFTKYREI